jgi:hypothetical protein
MARIPGRLLADLLPNGTVRENFLPDKTRGSAKPILSKDIGTAEKDFRETFGLTPGRAIALANELGSEKHVDIACDVDGAVLPGLCEVRGLGA